MGPLFLHIGTALGSLKAMHRHVAFSTSQGKHIIYSRMHSLLSYKVNPKNHKLVSRYQCVAELEKPTCL